MASIPRAVYILIFILKTSDSNKNIVNSSLLSNKLVITTETIRIHFERGNNGELRLNYNLSNEISAHSPNLPETNYIRLTKRRGKRFSGTNYTRNKNKYECCSKTNDFKQTDANDEVTTTRTDFTGKQGHKQGDAFSYNITILFIEPVQDYLKQLPIVITNDNETIVGGNLFKSSGELKFLDVPPGGGMRTPNLDLDNGYFIFSFVSTLVSYLQVSEFPSDLLKDWVWNQLSLIQLIFQTVRVEGGIIACLTVFVLLAVALPTAVLAQISCRLSSPDTVDPLDQELTDTQLRCRKVVLVILLELMLILLPLGIIGMFLSNDHLSKSVQRSPDVANAVLDDLNTFVRNTHLQIRFVATTSVDQAMHQAISDLDDVEQLLGRPIQRELAIETGIDVALDALSDICSASADIATEILTLRAEGQAARDAARAAQERLSELQKQVDTTIRQCIEIDKPLCDTVDTLGLEVTFKIDKMLGERKLSRLRHLAEDNFTTAARNARTEYQEIPRRIVQNTAAVREEIKNTLSKQRDILYNSIEALDEVSNDFTTTITVMHDHVARLVRTVADVEHWRWSAGLGSSLSVLLIWAILTTALICVHCGCATRLVPTFLIAVIMICITTVCLWTVAAVALIIGGNGQVFLCRPLYDSPNYTTLALLLDNPGILFKQGGMISNILHGNTSMDVPIKDVLRECEMNQPAFPTLNLNRILNIDSLTNHLTWPKLHGHLSKLSVNIGDIEMLKPTLQKYLQDISQASRVNLTFYRSKLSGPVTGTEVGAFADQLERIASRMSDLTTSARLETLASRSRKLLSNNLQRLEKHRDEVIFKLTALQVHLLPLQRQANQSLSHLKTIQYYLANQGLKISEKNRNEYVGRLIKYLERFREHVLNQLTYEVAPCRPVWDIFNTGRVQLCKHLVEPMNGFLMSTIWCLVLFITISPVIMISIDYYRSNYTNGDLRRDLNELLLADQGPWTTSTPHSTPESMPSLPQSSWATLRRPSEQLLIVPQSRRSPTPSRSPRRLAERSRLSPRPRAHESLRMIEASTWRNHNIPSPRGWL